MPTWDFRRESTQAATGANTQAAKAKGYQAKIVGGDGQDAEAEKRNVVVTSLGWVRRENRSSTRQIDQVLVAANPGSGFSYTANTYTGKPDIVQIYMKLNANGVVSANSPITNVYVVFNAPVHFKPSGNQITISLANTVGGNHSVGNFANIASQTRIINANNTLVFRVKLRGGTGSAKATYAINAQSLTVTGMPLYNPDLGLGATAGVSTTANLTITGAVSNNLLDGVGSRIGTFRVSPKGIA